jgi:hypothetical protein
MPEKTKVPTTSILDQAGFSEQVQREYAYGSGGIPIGRNEDYEKLAKLTKLNDANRWYENLGNFVLMTSGSAGSMLASVGLALSDLPDAIPDPFNFSVNGLRRMIWNIDPKNPLGYVGAFLEPEIAKSHELVNQIMKDDEISKMLTFKADDDMNIGFGPGGAGLNVGDIREWWKGQQDADQTNIFSKYFKKEMDAANKLVQDHQIKTGSETADYILNQSGSLIGSMLGSYLTGRISGALLGSVGKLKVPAKLNPILNESTRTAINNFGTGAAYQKTGQALTTFGMVASEAVMQGHQTKEEVISKMILETGGDAYMNGLQSFVDRNIQATKEANPDVPITDKTVSRITDLATKEYNRVWASQNPEEWKKIEEASLKAYRAVIDGSVMNYALNWTSSGLYIKKFFKTRNVLDAPGKALYKDILSEAAQEALEEGSTFVAGKFGEATAEGRGYTLASALKDLFSTEGIENMAWGAAGGAGQTGLVKVRDFKKDRANYKAQQEVIAKYDEIGRITNSEELRKQLHLTSNVAELGAIMENIEKLKSEGRMQEAELESNKILFNQAYTAFEFGTTKALIDSYEKLSQNKGITEEERQKALEATQHIKTLEQFYNESQGYINSEEVYHSQANVFFAEKTLKETQKRLLELASVAVPTVDVNGKGIETAYSIAYNTLNESYNNGLAFVQDAKENLAELKSGKTQEAAAYKNAVVKKLTAFQIGLSTKMKKKGQLFDPGTSQEYQDYFNKTINQAKADKIIASSDITALQTENDRAKKRSELVKDLASKEAAARAAQVAKASVKVETDQEKKTTPPVSIAVPTVSTEKKALNTQLTENINDAIPPDAGDIPGSISHKDDDDGGFLSPASVNPNMDEDKWDTIAKSMDDYVKQIKLENKGKMPSFSEFITDHIQNGSKESTEKLYDYLTKAWERNSKKNPEYKVDDYQKIYQELFSDKKVLQQKMDSLIEEQINTIMTVEDVTENPIEEEQYDILDEETGSVLEVISTDRILTFPGSTAGYTARASHQINDVDDEGRLIVTHELDSDEFFEAKHVNSKPLADPRKFNTGTKVVAEVHPNFNDVPFSFKWTSGVHIGMPMDLVEGQPTYTFGDVVKGIKIKVRVPISSQTEGEQSIIEVDYKLDEDTDAYWQQIPIVFYREGSSIKEGSGYIHTPDYYNETSHAEKDGREIAIAETIKIRELIRKQKVAKLTIQHRGEGALGKARVNKKVDDPHYPTMSDNDPESIIAIFTSDGMMVGGAGKLVPFENATRTLHGNRDAWKQGNAYELRKSDHKDGVTAYAPMVVNKSLTVEDADYFAQVQNSIDWALKIYMNQSNPAPEAQQYKDAGEKFLAETGYDLTDIEDFTNYIGLFVQMPPANRGDTMADVVRRAAAINQDIANRTEGSDNPVAETGMPFIFTLNKQIYILALLDRLMVRILIVKLL